MGARFIVNSGGRELLRCHDRHRMNSHGSSGLLPFFLSTFSVSLVSHCTAREEKCHRLIAILSLLGDDTLLAEISTQSYSYPSSTETLQS